MTSRRLAFIRDRHGSVAPLAAAVFVVMIGFAALAVDVGSFFYQKRRQQTANDLAAIAAANDIPNARRAAAATLARNGFGETDIVSLEPSIYRADGSVAPESRFAPADAGPNAVRLVLRHEAPIVFGRIFGSASAATPATGFMLTSRAVASRADFASFAIGSRLVQLDGGVLNAVLGSLLGSSLSLSLMDYQSLAAAKVDLFAFSNALAARAHLTAASYDDIAHSNVRVGDVLSAAVDAARTSPGSSATAIAALSQIANTKIGAADTMTLDQLVNFGPYGGLAAGSAGLAGASVSLLDLTSAALGIANGAHQVQAALGVNLPGIASASLQVAIGERPQGTSFATLGPEGVSVATAQTRLLLTIQLVGAGSIASVTLPVALELASSTARLNAIRCDLLSVQSTTVTLGVTAGLAEAWIGNVSRTDLPDFAHSLAPSPATLVNVAGLVTVTGRAHALIANGSAVPVTFTYADIQSATKKTTSTTSFVTPLLSKLIGDLQLNASVLGLGLGLPGGATTTVAQIVAGAAPSLDQLLVTTLSTLGIGLGQADTWVDGVRCGNAVLVN